MCYRKIFPLLNFRINIPSLTWLSVITMSNAMPFSVYMYYHFLVQCCCCCLLLLLLCVFFGGDFVLTSVLGKYSGALYVLITQKERITCSIFTCLITFLLFYVKVKHQFSMSYEHLKVKAKPRYLKLLLHDFRT